MGARGGHAHFPAKSGQKKSKLKIIIITWISHHQSIDNSVLSSHKNSVQFSIQYIKCTIYVLKTSKMDKSGHISIRDFE